MPELPEVETTRQGIAPYATGQQVTRVLVRERRLRWPISLELEASFSGQVICDVQRRGKYLLFRTVQGTLLIHLGMSGSLRVLRQETPPQKHDHVDIWLANGDYLRFTDPRRFGALLWTSAPPEQHPLLRSLGPEPLETDFSAEYLYESARNRKVCVKLFIMDSRIVVGVGNIYANEALSLAGIHPLRSAKRISLRRYGCLVAAIQQVLKAAIAQGGTTLRDFVSSEGKPGYFQQSLRVYGRNRQPCQTCGQVIQTRRVGQRSTYYCPHCQR
jgi:formamidopyrimidine-DNA glycosylase